MAIVNNDMIWILRKVLAAIFPQGGNILVMIREGKCYSEIPAIH